MVENKKVDPPKTEAAISPNPRVSADSPGDKLKVPTVGEVKQGVEIRPAVVVSKDPNKPTPDKIIADTVKRTADSVSKYNEAAESAKKADPVEAKKPDTVKAPTKEEAIEETVERTAESVERFNKSSADEKKIEAKRAVDLSPDVKRVAPLTGEIRVDQEDDSYVTPGKVLAPPLPPPSLIPAPEIEPAPLVIAPITGEIKPEDEVSYPTPGRMIDPDRVQKAVKITDLHRFGNKNTPFNVPEGHQVSLFEANKEMIRNKRANAEDNEQLAEAIAAAAVTGLDGLRRTRRAQKNLR